MAASAQFWLGIGGCVTVLVLATRWLRALMGSVGQRRQLYLGAEQLKQVWALPWVLCVVTESGSPVWVFSDEIAAPHWAALRRFLKQSLQRQALGLSISR